MSFAVVNGRRPRGAPISLGDQGNVRIAIWGQSNAIGRASQSDLAASPLSADPELQDYMDGTLPLTRCYIWTGSVFSQMDASNNGANAGQFGPEFGIAVRWMRETTAGNLYFEKNGISGSSIDPNFVPGYYIYENAITEHDQGTTWLASNVVTVAAKKWLWVQGETDLSQSQSWYETRLQALIDDRALQGAMDSTSIQVLAQMKSGTIGYGAGVSAAKTAIAAAAPSYIKTVQMSYYGGDNLHPNARGQLQLGYDAFEKFFGAAHINA